MDETFLHDLFAPVGPIALRRMFGGIGVYRDGIIFALVADGTLYLKADESTAAAFREAGSVPFVYEAKGKSVTMSYWRLPEEAMDDPDALARFARIGLEAARRAARRPKRASER